MPDPHDPRKSLYRAEDVAGLCRKKQVGRRREALAAGTIFGAEPCIYSAITTFSKGRPYYRGRDSIRLSDDGDAGEDVATILWNARAPVSFESGDLVLQGDERAGNARSHTGGLAACGHSTLGRADSGAAYRGRPAGGARRASVWRAK